MDKDVLRCWNAERSRRHASSLHVQEIDDAEWERFLEHNNKRQHYTEVMKSHSASKAEQELASQELPRHSFGLQHEGLEYLPTFTGRMALRVLQHGIGWWGEELHCMDCNRPRGIACSACGAAVCCPHHIMGGEKPRNFPRALGGMHIYCYDGAGCEQRWLQLHNHCERL